MPPENQTHITGLKKTINFWGWVSGLEPGSSVLVSVEKRKRDMRQKLYINSMFTQPCVENIWKKNNDE